MPRPKCSRKINNLPNCCRFNAGSPDTGFSAETIVLALDEFEAVRLADHEGHYHEKGAEFMQVSRQTFGRILTAARKKIAGALVNGKSITIDGGEIVMSGKRLFRCSDCGHNWDIPKGTGRPECCPGCKSGNFHRSDFRKRGHGQGFGRHGGHCRGHGRKSK